MSWFALAGMAVSVGVSVAGTAMSVAGQGKAGSDAYKAAAKQANNVIIEGRFKVNDVERSRLMTHASQKAAYATRGVKIEGSPLELLAETNYLASVDKARVEYEAQENADAIRAGGDAAFTSSRYGMVGSILGGVGNAASSAASGYKIGSFIGSKFT